MQYAHKEPAPWPFEEGAEPPRFLMQPDDPREDDPARLRAHERTRVIFIGAAIGVLAFALGLLLAFVT
jgi:hypothetical protein